jgi:hypothetical protein
MFLALCFDAFYCRLKHVCLVSFELRLIHSKSWANAIKKAQKCNRKLSGLSIQGVFSETHAVDRSVS